MIIGIDPGKFCHFAFLSNDMQDVVLKRAEVGTQDFKDVVYMVERMQGYSNERSGIFIEKVHSMPRDGHKGSFTFGQSFGYLLGAFELVGLQYSLVTPQAWRCYTQTHDKKDSIDYIHAKLPNVDLKLGKRCRVDNHNLADALCIAMYGHHLIVNKEGN